MLRVSAQEHRMRLDLFLAKRFPYYSRQFWQKRIKSGVVQIKGQLTKASRRLKFGDEVMFVYPKREEPQVNLNYEIIYEDDQIMAINKPPNLPVHPSGIYQKNTLYTLLKQNYPDQKIHFVNRIDRETSGLVILAKGKEIQRKLNRLWHTKNIQKEYLVIVVGNFPDYYLAEGYIGFGISKIRKKRVFLETKNPPASHWKWAVTEFWKLASKDKFSLVKAKLITGRSHQIRATLCSLGYPLAGDLLYGINEDYYLEFVSSGLSLEKRKELYAERSLLHSFRVFFASHVLSEKPQVIEAPIPADFLEIFPEKQLEKLLALS